MTHNHFLSFDFDTNRIKYSVSDFDDFMNSCLRFLFIYSQISQSWSSFMPYNSFHMKVFSDKNIILWFQDSCFDKYISDWSIISYVSLMKHNSWFIQSIQELAFWSQSSPSIMAYLHSFNMSKIITHLSPCTIMSIFASVQIKSCQLCVLSVWIIWNDFYGCVWISRLLIT